jgi:hypothetical protein
MNVTDFLGIGIVGGLLSLATQFIKSKMSTNENGAKFLTIGLSIFVGGVYVVFRDTIWWQTMIGVLGAATTVYSFIPLPEFGGKSK